MVVFLHYNMLYTTHLNKSPYAAFWGFDIYKFCGRMGNLLKMESFIEVWDSVKKYCEEHITNVAYNIWICCIDPVSFDGNIAVLSVRSPFQKGIIEEKYIDLLNKGFENALGFQIEINVVAVEDNSSVSENTNIAKSGISSEILNDNKNLIAPKSDQEYSFNNFIVGPSNKFAHAASIAVASSPSGAYNPLFIYGGSGLGKTHLLYAIRNEISQNNPELNII